MGEFEKHVTAEYLRRSANWHAEVKTASYERMGLETAQSVLDAGCGPGLDLIPIAERLPESGRVTGLDYSPEMLKAATGVLAESPLGEKCALVQGSVLSMPFADAGFDAVRAERLFQVLPQDLCPPDKVFAELVRVLKPGGRLVLVDVDWATVSVDFPDLALERRLLRFFGDVCRPNGYAARQFKGWLARAGFREIAVSSFPQFIESAEDCPIVGWLADEAKKRGAATDAELDYWCATLREKAKTNELCASVNMLVVSGVKA
ncbi:MAG TPA: methyltransferase domain-containing protein [Opitutales bacterium]|nr:methyltransferase domain-containing protein [Opitutales bacterium]